MEWVMTEEAYRQWKVDSINEAGQFLIDLLAIVPLILGGMIVAMLIVMWLLRKYMF
jgi:hypothetical protein